MMEFILQHLDVISAALAAIATALGIKLQKVLPIFKKAQDVVNLVDVSLDAIEDGKITKEEVQQIKDAIAQVKG